MSNSEMIFNSEKAVLARYILSIDSEELLARVKKTLAGFVTVVDHTTQSKTDYVLSQLTGKWEDSKDADAMLRDIYNARISKRKY